MQAARGEAGALDRCADAHVLPSVFRAHPSDLDASSSSSSLEPTPRAPEPPAVVDAPLGRPVASAWRKVLAPRAPGQIFLPGRRAEVAEADLRLILQKDLDAEVLPSKTSELRARVRVADNLLCTVVVVVTRAEEGGARLVVRRSFADCFRVANDLFDRFCGELGQRLVLLRAV